MEDREQWRVENNGGWMSRNGCTHGLQTKEQKTILVALTTFLGNYYKWIHFVWFSGTAIVTIQTLLGVLMFFNI